MPDNPALQLDTGVYGTLSALGEDGAVTTDERRRRMVAAFVQDEVLPHPDLYRRKAEQGLEYLRTRPGLSELLHGTSSSMPASPTLPSVTSSRTLLGWFNGVCMQCLLSIWGVMLFLRLTWVIGQAGLVQGLIIITLCNVITLITAISMSAVATNGRVSGGGIYYMVSRTLGPELGGGIGVMFTVANAIAVAMYVIGFCEAFLDILEQNIADWVELLAVINYTKGVTGYLLGVSSSSRVNDVRLVGCVTLVLLAALAVLGLHWVTRVQGILLMLLVASQVNFVVGSFLQPTEEQLDKGFVGYSIDVFKDNLWSDYAEGHDFTEVLAVFFPAVTGIMAGANISGDLRDPGKAIPRGTLLAVAITYLSYMAYAVMAAGCALRHAQGPLPGEVSTWNNATEMEPAENVSDIAALDLNCEAHRNCSFGLANSQQMMEVISAWSPLIYAGCFSATLSSAIAALEGAPRVLQALARDRVFPGIVVFARGKGANKEPLWGYLLVSAIALACICVGDLNVVSGILSNFFAVTYAVVNFASFHAGLNAGTPGWRPSFACHSRLLSLVGTLLCVAIMLAMDYITAVATFLCLALFYAYVRYWSRPPSSVWGTSSQSHAFDAALGAVKRHGAVGEHVKNFRPRLAVLSGDPCQRPELVRFGSILASSAASFMVCVNVIDGGAMAAAAGGQWLLAKTSKASAEDWLRRNRIRSFAAATCSNCLSDGIRPVLELLGLGGLTPNAVLMGFKSKWAESPDRGEEFYRVVRTTLDMHFSVCVLRSAATLNSSSTLGQFYMTGRADEQQQEAPPLVDLSKKRYLDVYWLLDDGGLTPLVAHVLATRARAFSDCAVRVFLLPETAVDQKEVKRQKRDIRHMLDSLRLRYRSVSILDDLAVMPTDETRNAFDAAFAGVKEQEWERWSDKTCALMCLSESMRLRSSSTAELVVVSLPLPADSVPPALYLAWIDFLSRGFKTALLVRGNHVPAVTAYL